MPEVAQRWGFDIGLVAMGHNAIGGAAVAFWNAMGMIAVAVVNAMGLVTFSPVNSMGLGGGRRSELRWYSGRSRGERDRRGGHRWRERLSASSPSEGKAARACCQYPEA